MRFKRKEKSKLLSRRRLWSFMGWFWIFKKKADDKEIVDTTCDLEDGGGMGFFKKNHSLNCGCAQCRNETKYRRYDNKRKRLRDKRIVRNIQKQINGHKFNSGRNFWEYYDYEDEI